MKSRQELERERKAFLLIENIKNLRIATQKSYKYLSKFYSHPALPLRRFDIYPLIRLWNIPKPQLEYNHDLMIERLGKNTKSYIIVKDLYDNGNATRSLINTVLRDKYKISIGRSTLYEDLQRLIFKGWVDYYKVRRKVAGRPYTYYFYKGIGNEVNIMSSTKNKKSINIIQ